MNERTNMYFLTNLLTIYLFKVMIQIMPSHRSLRGVDYLLLHRLGLYRLLLDKVVVLNRLGRLGLSHHLLSLRLLLSLGLQLSCIDGGSHLASCSLLSHHLLRLSDDVSLSQHSLGLLLHVKRLGLVNLLLRELLLHLDGSLRNRLRLLDLSELDWHLIARRIRIPLLFLLDQRLTLRLLDLLAHYLSLLNHVVLDHLVLYRHVYLSIMLLSE
jgi:hypothetical protein